MSPVSVVPQAVPAARVRRLPAEAAEGPRPVEHVDVRTVPVPLVLPRRPQ